MQQSETPAHVWLRPKVITLLEEARAAGIERDIAVAVLLDLLAGPEFNSASAAIADQAELGNPRGDLG